jgi:uncharacterized protein (TIGR02265 family)
MMASVKGSNLVQVVKALRMNREAALASLPEKHRHYLQERILPSSWYPEADQLELLAVLASILPPGGDAWELFGRASAQVDMNGIYKRLVHPGDPERTLRNAPVAWRNLHDSGELEVSMEGERRGSITLRDYPVRSAEMCRLIGAYLAETLGLAGAREARTAKRECRARGASQCTWSVTWT